MEIEKGTWSDSAALPLYKVRLNDLMGGLDPSPFYDIDQQISSFGADLVRSHVEAGYGWGMDPGNHCISCTYDGNPGRNVEVALLQGPENTYCNCIVEGNPLLHIAEIDYF